MTAMELKNKRTKEVKNRKDRMGEKTSENKKFQQTFRSQCRSTSGS